MSNASHESILSDGIPTDEQAAIYDRLMPMLDAAHREMTEFSKKKQDGVLNALKIRNINRLLDKLELVLSGDPSLPFLEKLDEETMPQNSDSVLLLSQWKAALHQFHFRHYRNVKGSNGKRWVTIEDPDDLV
jgi:hypothetical protein